MTVTSEATAAWKGNLFDGSGTVTLVSSGLATFDVNWKARSEGVAATTTPEELIGSVRNGLYVTELIGFGVNGVTGDYSRGAAGLWIEDGRLAYPVEEVTIAGNLLDMFAAIDGVGNDLVLRDRTVAPTLRISRMVVAGN